MKQKNTLTESQKHLGETIKLRFPPDEYKAIKRAAEKDRRSIQNFVQYATVEMLKSRGEIR